jgi:hypothetical protein
MKRFTAMAVVLALGGAPALAAEPPAQADQLVKPAKLTDGELDQVVAGDPLIFVNVAAPIDVRVAPITVKVDVPINVNAIVQANVLGNAVMDAVAVGTQNVFQAASAVGPVR